MRKNISILLHNVRSTHNVGAIFRTADAVDAAKIFLTGFTPTPLDRFGRPQKDVAKTALGAEKVVAWEYHKNPFSLIKKLKEGGAEIVGVEQDDRAVDYRKFRSKTKLVLVFGNEVKGLSTTILSKCDKLVEIPMRGATVKQANHPRHTRRGKESLNVSVAAGIVLYHTTSAAH